MEMTLKELAVHLSAKVIGDENTVVTAVAGIEEARQGDITFVVNPRYRNKLDTTRASAVIVSPDITEAPVSLLATSNPYIAFVKALELFHPVMPPEPGISSQAYIDSSAELGEGVTVYPFVHIGAKAKIGDRTVLHPFVCVGEGGKIGNECRLYSHVVIREHCVLGDRVILHDGVVVGSDGFGFAQEGSQHLKIPQIGIVRIGDDVEVGANTCIDRATMGETRIGRGTKIDNLVQVAHNVSVGEDAVLVSQTGISGSTSIGDRAVIGGQVGIVGHVQIGHDVKIGAKSGVHTSIQDGQVVAGIPSMPYGHFLKTISVFKHLPQIRARLKKLEKEVQTLAAVCEAYSKTDVIED